jgi:hypothetical protein
MTCHRAPRLTQKIKEDSVAPAGLFRDSAKNQVLFGFLNLKQSCRSALASIAGLELRP